MANHEESKATSESETTFEDPKELEMEPDKETGESKMEVESTKEKQAVAEKEAEAKKDDEDDANYPHGLKLWIILSALCLAVFLVALDQTVRSLLVIFDLDKHFDSTQSKDTFADPTRSFQQRSQKSRTNSTVFKT